MHPEFTQASEPLWGYVRHALEFHASLFFDEWTFHWGKPAQLGWFTRHTDPGHHHRNWPLPKLEIWAPS